MIRRFERIGRATIAAMALSVISSVQSAAAIETVKIALTETGSMAPFFIAQDTGLFTKAGLDVQLVVVTASTVVSTVLSGTADIGATTPTAGFYNAAANGDLKIISGMVAERAGFRSTTFLASPAGFKAGITTPKDLVTRSKRIAISAIGAPFHYALIQLSLKHGLDPAKLTTVSLQTNPNIIAALSGNSADAGIVSGVQAAAADAAGNAKIIGYVGDETEYNSHVIYASRTAIERRREVVLSVLKSALSGMRQYDEAFQRRNSNGQLIRGQNAGKFLQIISKYTKEPPESIEKALTYILPDGAINAVEIERHVKNWKSVGLVNQSLDSTKVVDLSIWAAATR